MPDQGQATFDFGGILAYEGAEGTDVCGIAPASFTATVYPQLQSVQLIADIILQQDGRKTVFKDCLLDDAQYSEGSNGQEVACRFLDERWRWTTGYVIDGKWNVRLADGNVDPFYQKTPYELAAMLFPAFGVTSFDADILKTGDFSAARPLMDWEVASPAQELQRMCEDFGLRICPQRSSTLAPTKWVICRTGVGAQLRSDIPYSDTGQGINPANKPHALRLYGAPTKFQVRLPCEAVGREIYDPRDNASGVPTLGVTTKKDASWKLLKDLSYRPIVSNPNLAGDYISTFRYEDSEFEEVSTARILQDEGGYQVAQDIARQTVFKSYRIKIPEGGILIDGYRDKNGDLKYVKRKNIVLTNEICSVFTDAEGVKRPKPAFLDIIGYHELMPENAVNCAAGTRIDIDESDIGESSTAVTCSINTEQLTSAVTSSAGIITVSQCLRRHARVDDAVDDDLAAKVWVNCAVMVIDEDTGQLVRYTLDKVLDGAPPPPSGGYIFVQPIRQDDVQLNWVTTYILGEDGEWLSSETTSNEYDPPDAPSGTPGAKAAAQYYLDAKAKEMETLDQQTRNYLGFWPTTLDGAITQASYKITKSGFDTTVSRNTEHDLRRVSYKEAQREVKRNDLEAAKKAADDAATKANAKKGKK